MLFVATLKAVAGTPQDRMARRLQWQHPEGMRPVAEYWLQGNQPSVVAIFEADSVAPIFQTLGEWGDLFEFNVVPAITAEEGLRLAERMTGGGG